MLPDDWGDGHAAPEAFTSTIQWRQVYSRYEAMLRPASRPTSQLKAIWNAVEEAGADRGLRESEYIDADYRDEYANFYATVYTSLPDRTERVHFWRPATDDSSAAYLGFTVMRPVLERPVGRTLIRPPSDLESAVSCLARFDASAYGFRQTVDAFPFMQQDRQFGVCAHAAIWSVALYYHARHGAPRRYLSDIVEVAARYRDLVRPTPSGGLYAHQIAAIVDELGFSPIIYRAGAEPHGETLYTLACRYLAGAIPALLVTPEHASVLIGYRNTPDGLQFVASDDARRPYRTIDTWNLPATEAWQLLIIPLPGRIYLAAENAQVTARAVLLELLHGDPAQAGIADELRQGRLRLQTYASTAADYRRHVRMRAGFPAEARMPLATSPASHWLWITELQDPLAPPGADTVAEIATDATGDQWTPNALFALVPGAVLRWRGPGAATVARFPVAHESTARYASGARLPAPV